MRTQADSATALLRAPDDRVREGSSEFGCVQEKLGSPHSVARAMLAQAGKRDSRNGSLP